jgi:MYXO-CTERM domain-containing protein
MKNLLMSGGKVLLAGTMLTSFTNRVNAAATLTIYDGVNPLITVVDNGPGDMIGAIGAILVQTNVGVWNLDINTAITKPLFGSATAPVMDLSVQASSTAAGSLRFVFSDNGFGPASGLLSAIVTGHVVSGAPTTVTYDVYGDPANVVGATTVDIASAGTTALPTTATGSGPLALPAPFSLTQVETFVASGATSIIADASFQVVPEPGVMGLGALGLAVFALGRPRRRQA